MSGTKPEIIIEELYGPVPVEAKGTVNGVRFYFRSRGARWRMGIGGTVYGPDADFYHEEPYGTFPDAGYITDEEARAFIEKAATLYASRNEAGPDSARLELQDRPV